MVFFSSRDVVDFISVHTFKVEAVNACTVT
jgi:hypothetical protein